MEFSQRGDCVGGASKEARYRENEEVKSKGKRELIFGYLDCIPCFFVPLKNAASDLCVTSCIFYQWLLQRVY